MGSDWLNDLTENSAFAEDPIEAFYCPYTNTAQCALLAKGWQPQELCLALECDRLKVVQPHKEHPKRHKAA